MIEFLTYISDHPLFRLLQTHFIEVIAALLSLWCVYLAAKNHILNWPIAMLASLLYFFVFYQNRFFSESYLQGFFFVFQAYGWWFWSKYNGNKTEKNIGNIPKKTAIKTLISFIFAYTIWTYVYLRINPDAQLPYLDAFLTILSLTALWMQAHRWIENWFLWIFADICYVPMFFWGKSYITATLYGVFIFLAIKGYYMWRKEQLLTVRVSH